MPATFQQQDQYDMPLVYTHSDQVLAQELEKQVGNIDMQIIQTVCIICIRQQFQHATQKKAALLKCQ